MKKQASKHDTDRINLLAIDPAKSKPSIGAQFVDGKFRGFLKFSHKQIITFKAEHWDGVTWHSNRKNIVIIEKPYFNKKHSPKNQVSLAIAVGEISMFFRDHYQQLEYIESWGTKGWIQSYFGRKTKREDALILAERIAKADGVKCKNDDYAMAYCLGLYWLRNNRNF